MVKMVYDKIKKRSRCKTTSPNPRWVNIWGKRRYFKRDCKEF